MPKWVKRLREIAAHNPDALPTWLRQSAAEKAWYRVSWQTDGGVSAEDGARPVIMMLDWLARRGLLTQRGMTALNAARSGEASGLVLVPSMVEPKAAAFLDAYWDKWWESNGINLSISPECAPTAFAAIEQYWADFGTAGKGRA